MALKNDGVVARYSRGLGWLGIVMLLTSITVAARDCDYLPATPQPPWVVSPVQRDDVEVASGSAEITASITFTQALDIARLNALKTLSESLSVSVQSQSQLQTAANLSEDNQPSSQFYQSMVQTVATRTLEGASIVERWLDRRHCTVWTLVGVPKAQLKHEADKAAAQGYYAILQAMQKGETQKLFNFNQAKSHLAKAMRALQALDGALLDSFEGESFWQQALAQWQQDVQQQDVSEAAALQSLAQFRRDYERWKSAPVSERAAQAAALEKLGHDFLVRYPVGERFSDSGEQMTLLLAELTATAGDPCAAKKRLQRALDQSPNQSIHAAIAQKANGLSCGKDGALVAALVQQFARTEPITISCSVSVSGVQAAWLKACAEVAKQLQIAGFDVASNAEVAEAVRAIGVVPLAASANAASRQAISFEAVGSVESRDNADNPMGKDFRFKGAITTTHRVGQKVIFSDAYNGMGGWNPVSEEMAKDVLALIVVKKWKEKQAKMVEAQK